jgi:hypothetical protein
MRLSNNVLIELGSLGSSQDIGVIGFMPSMSEERIELIKNSTDLGETAMDHPAWSSADRLYTEILFECEDCAPDSITALARQIVHALARQGVNTSLNEQVYNLDDRAQALFIPRSLD